MKGINLTLAKVTSCDRWLVTSRRFFFYTYLRSTSFCYVCSPFVGSDDQRLSYYVTNVVVVLPPLPTD